ncbi:MAG: hypothetical protein RSD47_11715 [Romboutsia sp.]
MRINKKILIPIILIICGVWVYNIAIFVGSKIEEPLFLIQDSDTDEYGSVNIKYLENIHSKDPIQKVEFPEIGDTTINTIHNRIYSKNNVSFNELDIVLSDISISNFDENGNVLITKMIYETSSGKRKEVNIGEIIVSKAFVYDKKYKILSQNGMSGSSAGEGKEFYNTKDNLEITDIESEHLNDINRFFEVFIGTEKLENIDLPITVNRGYPIEISYKIKDGLTRDDFKVDQYNMDLKLKCSDPEGTIDYITVNLNAGIESIKGITNPMFIKEMKNRLEVK